ncbi:hypothetical protein CE68_23865, partial [Salmonella enterica subsp. enterica serovar Kentucky]|nr:hypothetical protein [Salmonella enterica]EBM8459698.1 hypothetical protein [Salmonella enterica subsp. enterica serovar Kentucky]ECV4851081.1 hypothetical protein [Salmonella enterica subsp. enterica serovar Kentucky]EDM5575416.1 hypothetical protein [Salmonella enterica subsp. enterica serovar Kentucky]EEB4703582.1 hypothetical protein [Salmonella enterica subsp. enterica serovar Kentucky]
MKSLGILLFLFLISVKVFAVDENYKFFLKEVISNSESIKSKEALVNAEELNELSAKLYAIPKLSGTVTQKHTRINTQGYIESRLILNSLLFDDVTLNTLKSQHYKLLGALVDLDKEKETIVSSVMSDQINISLYEKLRSNAQILKRDSEKLHAKINVKDEVGIIKESDVKLAELLVQKIDNEIYNIDRVIEQRKLDIESKALYPYPARGITISSDKVSQLLSLKKNATDLANNLDLKKIMLSKLETKENAKAQDSLYSINLIAENKYRDREMNKDDTFLGVRLSVNLFNLDNKLAKLSDL